jgi:hypothetical protein
MFRNAFINVYLLRVSNLKGCVHSQPQIHFYLKQYKELPCFSLSFCFHLPLHLDKGHEWEHFKDVKKEIKEKEVERKVEAFRREHIEKKKVKHVWLIGAIYVEAFASHTPTTKETKVFEQE